MNVFRNAIFLAAFAGLVAGLGMTALQTLFTVPLILEAETYENAGGGGHSHAGETAEADEDPGGHDHGAEAWAPEDGTERTLYTAFANIVTAIGFALLLVAVSEISGGIANWRAGLMWGFAGFASFTLAPGLGLPPELPGMPAADLLARQSWWIFTVAATAIGIGLVALRSSAPLALLGIALIVAPHVIGAPQPETHDTAVPADLHHRFVVAVTVTNLVFWLLLGAAVAVLRQRFAAGSAAPRQSLA